MKKTINSLFLAGLSIIFSQVCLADDGRTDLPGPGDAEVIAGTGYTHTLFDSADNKCQHCHNDLYDTWKTSMHAKSWVDPIFMSKYQDFLRLQASKIGLVGPTGTYEVATIQKTSKVCVKCHAPTAYYSNDYDVKVTEVVDLNEVADDEVADAYEAAKVKYETNLAPAYNPELPATVVSMATTGMVYTVSYHIGNSHNREGINCAYCHSIETVRMMNDTDGDGGQYKLAGAIKAGPIGPIVRYPGDVLYYSPFAHEPDMNAFFGLIGPEKYIDAGDTPKDEADFDVNKAADGRHTIKSIVTGCETYDDDGNCTSGYYTGGPFYGPFGVTGKSNSRDDDLSDREALVNQHFVEAVDDAEGDKFESEHQFAAYGKSLCLSCHQRSSLALNPESNGIDGVQVGDDQFLELCSTWSAMSDGVGNNFEDTETSPKCQRCHMEPLTTIDNEDAIVLHQWDLPDTLFTLEDEPDLTHHFLTPEDGGEEGPVAEGYLNNHAFMGANTADFGTIKIESGFESEMKVKTKERRKIEIETYLTNKTAHMFPGAHPMRRVLTRMVVTDAKGNKLSFNQANGKSKFEDVTNELAVLDGNEIMSDFDTIEVKYEKGSDVEIQGMSRDLRNEHVSSQFMDDTVLDWVSPDGTVINSEPVCTIDPDTGDCIEKSWVIKGTTTVKKITDIKGPAENFTRIYGRETGKRAPDGTHVVRPGFDSNIAADNRLKPNETEKYRVTYNTRKAKRPLTVNYKVYYLKKGGSGVFEALTADDGFLKERSDFPEGDDGDAAWAAYSAKLKKAAIYEVYSQEKTIK